ncbi:DUF4139 domain-containing protein [Hydrogenimonas sp.]
MDKGFFMKRFALFISIAFIVSLHGSQLELYRDGAVYTFRPAGSFMGFLPKGSGAECRQETVSLVAAPECPAGVRLCKERERIERYALDSAEALQQMHYIEMLMKRAKVEEARKLLDLSKAAAARYAELQKRKKSDEMQLKWCKEAFLKQAASMEPLHLSRGCEGDVKLTIPGRYITFDMLYEADVAGTDAITIVQHLGLTNRSGIDITARSAMLYYRPMHRYLRPIRFQPWVVRDRSRPQIRALQKSAVPMAADAMPVPERASYEEVQTQKARNYRITGLKLPSNGERVDIVLQKWQNGAERSEVVYPYRDRRVFRVVRFRPDRPIETDRWRIRSGEKVIAADVRGEFVDGRYTLFLSVDEDLAVERERMILKEKESLFGGILRKKDGYIVRVVNQSGEAKKLSVIERIPVATRSDVEVKLLNVSSNRPMRYRLHEKGKLTIDLTIPPHAETEVRVLFEVSFDKEKPVVF